MPTVLCACTGIHSHGLTIIFVLPGPVSECSVLSECCDLSECSDISEYCVPSVNVSARHYILQWTVPGGELNKIDFNCAYRFDC